MKLHFELVDDSGRMTSNSNLMPLGKVAYHSGVGRFGQY